MNGIVGRKHLVSLRRDKVKATQKQFADMVGISLDTLKSYESGRRILTVEKFSEIKRELGYFESEKHSLRVMIDYLRITFKSVSDLDFFCRKYLHCPLSDFQSSDTKLMMYSHLWQRGDIWIFDYADKTQTGNYQMTLQLSGAGCRQFELIMERENLTWLDFLQKLHFERHDMKVTRIDIAMDEMYLGSDREDEHFSLLDLLVKTERDLVYRNRISTFNYIGGGSLDLENGHKNGLSLYYGSRQSSMFFNFYEKRYELAKKEKMTVEESLAVFDIWNRYEVRLSQGKANRWVEEFVSGVPIDDLSKGLVRSKLDVFDGTDEYGVYLPDKKWQRLFGGDSEVYLSVSPEPFSIERTVKWLVYQVSNSLKFIEEADKIMETGYLSMIMESGELTEEAEKTLAQLFPEDSKLLEERIKLKLQEK